jgi:hypothetical protein
MFNQSGIKKTTSTGPVQILANVQIQYSLGVVVSGAGVTAVDGRKIIKAGTPISGDIDARTTAFTQAAIVELESNAVGVLLHDIDVTDGNANGTMLIFGFVNTNRLDTVTKALITAEVKEALKAKVTFIAC